MSATLGTASPAVRRRGWLAAQLPAAMLEDPGSADPFLPRFVQIFEDVAETVLRHVDALEHHLDPDVCPGPLATWLGAWLGLDTDGLPLATERRLVRTSGRLLAFRGTAGSLAAFVAALTGCTPHIRDSGGVLPPDEPAPRGRKEVVVEIPTTGPLTRAQLEAALRRDTGGRRADPAGRGEPVTAQLLAIAIEPSTVTLTPGGQASVAVAIRNTTRIVGDFAVGLVNPHQLPIVAGTKDVNLKVGEAVTVLLALAMPADARPTAGDHVAGVRVTSTTVALVGAVEELRITVPPSGDAVMRVEPEVSARGRYVVRMQSRSTAPLRLAVTARDAEGTAKFAIDPPLVDLAPYAQVTAQVRVRARRPFTGNESRRQLAFDASGDGTSLTATATLVRRPLVPPALLRFVAAFILLLVLAAAIVAGAILDDFPWPWESDGQAGNDPSTPQDGDGGG